MHFRTVFILALSLCNVAMVYAKNSYYPPAKMHCSVVSSVATCDGFNRKYLVEGRASADSDEVEFVFKLGHASYSLRHTECMLNYVYENANHETVYLQSAQPFVRPDFDDGHWLQLHDDEFVCRDGNGQCALNCASC